MIKVETPKVWFITGAGSGLGLALAEKALANGDKVAGTSRNLSRFEKTKLVEYKDNFLPLESTLLDEKNVEEIVNKTVEKFGRIDVVVNNAGFANPGAVEELSNKEIRDNFDINFFAPVTVCRYTVPILRKQGSGHIYNIASITAFTRFPGCSAYSSSKWALHGLTITLAAELKQFGVLVTCVCPGTFQTPILEGFKYSEKVVPEYNSKNFLLEWLDRRHGRPLGDPEKYAEVLCQYALQPTCPISLFVGGDAVEVANEQIEIMTKEIKEYIPSNQAIQEWPLGVSNRSSFEYKGKSPSSCSFKSDFVPWPVFFPKGYTYFIVGEQTCPDTPSIAELDPSTNTLSVDFCHEEDSPTFTVQPNFLEAQKKTGVYPKNLIHVDSYYSPLEKTFNYTEPVVVKSETILVKCGSKSEILIQNVKNEEVNERASHFNQPTVPIPETASPIKTMPKEVLQKPINILILMIDALSRAHFNRALPKTFDRLKEIQDSGVATVFQFFRYHSLKPFTDNNAIAMYTGYNSLDYADPADHELREKLSGEPHEWESNPMFFQSFRNDSYVNAWVNGYCQDWFQHYLFKAKPENTVDHELLIPYCAPEAYPLNLPFSNFNGPYSFRRRCLGNKHIHNTLFNYINQYWDNYPDVGKIATATFMDAHEGSMDVIKFADDGFSNFVGNDMKSRMNDTSMIFLSDHGSHMGLYYMFTEGGKVEVATPVLYLTLPNWFLNAHPDVHKNLLENENKLASPFQLYSTLRALSTYPEFGGIDMMDPEGKRIDKGLLGHIPDDISCKDLGIPSDFCQCK
eukprot:gene396-500_t